MRRIIPPSTKNSRFQILDIFGGLGIIEITIIFFVLILSSIVLIFSGILIGIFISIFFVFAAFLLIKTNKRTRLKGWEQFSLLITFAFAKKSFTRNELYKNTFIYKFNDKNETIKVGNKFITAFTINGKDISRLNFEEREQLIENLSKVYQLIDNKIFLYKIDIENDRHEIIDKNLNFLRKNSNKNEKFNNQIFGRVAVELIKEINMKEKYIFLIIDKIESAIDFREELINELRTINLYAEKFEYNELKKFIYNFYKFKTYEEVAVDETKEINTDLERTTNFNNIFDNIDLTNKNNELDEQSIKYFLANSSFELEKELLEEKGIEFIEKSKHKKFINEVMQFDENIKKELIKTLIIKDLMFGLDISIFKKILELNNIEIFNEEVDNYDLIVKKLKNQYENINIYYFLYILKLKNETDIFMESNMDKNLKELFPKKMIINKDYLKIDGEFVSFVSISKYPFYPLDGWSYLFTNFENVIPKFMISYLDQQKSLKQLDTVIQRNKLSAETTSTSKIKEMEKANELYTELIESIKSGNEKILDYSILLMVRADSLKELKKLKKTLFREAKKDGIELMELTYRHYEGFVDFLPKNTYTLPVTTIHEIPSNTIASSFPFLIDDFIDENGLYISKTRTGGEIYLNNELRNDQRFNSNSIILGASGSGKSVTSYKLVLDDVIRGNKVFIIDPEREYKDLANTIDGKTIDLSGQGKYALNPLQILREHSEEEEEEISEEEPNYIASHISFLGEFIEITNQQLNFDVKILIQNELNIFYQSLRITNKKIHNDYDKIKWPIFQEFKKFLEIRVKKTEGNLKSLYDIAILIISQYGINGTYENIWNREQNVDLNSDLIVFDTNMLVDNKYKIAGQMLLITKIIWTNIQENKEKNVKKGINKFTSLFIDEAHLFMNSDNLYTLQWMQQTTKRIRKYNGKIYLITQNVKDFLGDEKISKYTEGILNNITYSFIGNLRPNDLQALEKMYSSHGGINEIEKNFITNAGRGKFLLMIGDKIKYFIEKIEINVQEAKLFAPQILNSRDKYEIDLEEEIFEKIKNQNEGEL